MDKELRAGLLDYERRLGISQGEHSRRLGISQGQLSRFLAGKSAMGVFFAQAIYRLHPELRTNVEAAVFGQPTEREQVPA